jgi:hypothetical protein
MRAEVVVVELTAVAELAADPLLGASGLLHPIEMASTANEATANDEAAMVRMTAILRLAT